MARIRTVKPTFFRHEGLQELELNHPGKYPMFVFEGLWGHCDKLGRFRWSPRTLKLDILPFLPFDIADTLAILERHGYVRRYVVDGKEYGLIPTFTDHQRINGREAQEPCEFPDPPSEDLEKVINLPGKHWGSVEEAVGKQSGSITDGRKGREGKGREQERKGTDSSAGTESSDESTTLPALASPSLTVKQVVELWNATPGVRVARSVTGPIQTVIQRRIQEHGSLEWFDALFARVAQSDFLTGRKTDFAASLDWVLGPKNLAKILAGNYDNREQVNGYEAMKEAFINS